MSTSSGEGGNGLSRHCSVPTKSSELSIITGYWGGVSNGVQLGTRLLKIDDEDKFLGILFRGGGRGASLDLLSGTRGGGGGISDNDISLVGSGGLCVMSLGGGWGGWFPWVNESRGGGIGANNCPSLGGGMGKLFTLLETFLEGGIGASGEGGREMFCIRPDWDSFGGDGGSGTVWDLCNGIPCGGGGGGKAAAWFEGEGVLWTGIGGGWDDPCGGGLGGLESNIRKDACGEGGKGLEVLAEPEETHWEEAGGEIGGDGDGSFGNGLSINRHLTIFPAIFSVSAHSEQLHGSLYSGDGDFSGSCGGSGGGCGVSTNGLGKGTSSFSSAWGGSNRDAKYGAKCSKFILDFFPWDGTGGAVPLGNPFGFCSLDVEASFIELWADPDLPCGGTVGGETEDEAPFTRWSNPPLDGREFGLELGLDLGFEGFGLAFFAGGFWRFAFSVVVSIKLVGRAIPDGTLCGYPLLNDIGYCPPYQFGTDPGYEDSWPLGEDNLSPSGQVAKDFWFLPWGGTGGGPSCHDARFKAHGLSMLFWVGIGVRGKPWVGSLGFVATLLLWPFEVPG